MNRAVVLLALFGMACSEADAARFRGRARATTKQSGGGNVLSAAGLTTGGQVWDAAWDFTTCGGGGTYPLPIIVNAGTTDCNMTTQTGASPPYVCDGDTSPLASSGIGANRVNEAITQPASPTFGVGFSTTDSNCRTRLNAGTTGTRILVRILFKIDSAIGSTQEMFAIFRNGTDRFNLGITTAEQLRLTAFLNSSSYAPVSATLAVDTWQFVDALYDNNTGGNPQITYYYNGTEEVETAHSGTQNGFASQPSIVTILQSGALGLTRDITVLWIGVAVTDTSWFNHAKHDADVAAVGL